MAAGHQGEALILRSGHQDEWTIQIDIREGDIPFSGKTDHPIAGILELLQRPVEIDDPGHGHVLQSPRRHFGG